MRIFRDVYNKAVRSLRKSCMLELELPADKSISHRAILLSSLAEGRSIINNCLLAEDCLATIAAMRLMGVVIAIESDASLIVDGVGLHGLTKPQKPIDCGNSGTTMRLLAGILVAQKFSSTLIGDASLMQRPMLRIAEPLRLMGARLELSSQNTAPIEIHPVECLNAIMYHLPIPSAQVKSCVQLAGLYAEGTMQIIESIQTRNHTELMLESFGYPGTLTATSLQIPGDISSAAFFIVAATLTEHPGVCLKGIGLNPTRTRILDLLIEMGAKIMITNQGFFGAELVGDLIIMPSKLKGLRVTSDVIPACIDELPILAIAAACAEGETLIEGAGELRVKESDRLHALALGLAASGISVEEYPEGLKIKGGQFQPANIQTYRDHRIAMAFNIAETISGVKLNCDDTQCIATSFPHFVELRKKFDSFIQALG